MIELQAAIGKLAEAKIEIFVDRSCVDQMIGYLVRLIPELLKIDAKPFLDQRMIEHLLEHLRVTLQRHRLERIAEIAIVRVRPCRNARRDLLIELGWIQAPLLA